jgi:transketolase
MKFDKTNAKQWFKMGPRAMFGQFMLDIAKKNKDLIVLSADLGRSSGLARFKSEFPDQYLSVGISEQNLIGVAAGLANEGHKVFVTSFAPFLSMRASEQIRMNLGYMKHNVNLVALGSGLSMGFLGNSHFGLEDIAIMRTIPNMNITCPADCAELGKVLNDYAFNNRGPSYIRLTGVPGSDFLYEENYKYKFAKIKSLFKGEDLLILSYGSILGQIKLSIRKIKKKYNLDIGVINVSTIKPIDNSLEKIIKNYKKILVIEEHTTIGGLGSIVSELIAKHNIETNFSIISLSDKFGPTGKYEYLLKIHGLDEKSITKKVLKLLKKK